MNPDRKTAVAVGILFIVATAASLTGSSISDPILAAPGYLAGMAGNAGRILGSALFTFLAAGTSVAIAVVLYPVLRRSNEALALGAVVFRTIEGVFYIVAVMCLLALLALGQEILAAGGVTQAAETLGGLLLTVKALAGFVFGAGAFCIGGFLYYVVFYQARLVPRWLSAWGLLGCALLLCAILLTASDGAPFTLTGNLVFLAMPIALQEMVLAVWLLVKGFNTSGAARQTGERAVAGA
jgi:Domain of unknown function (DUF4386)